MTNGVLTTEAQLLLHCMRTYCDEDARNELGELLTAVSDWDKLITLADGHKVTSLMASRLLEERYVGSVPNAVRDSLKRSVYSAIRHDVEYREWLSSVLDLMTSAGLAPVLLKGMSLADRFYPASYLRPSGDIDLLVRPEELVQAGLALIDAGYKLKHHLPSAVDELEGLDLSPLYDGSIPVASPAHSRWNDHHLSFETSERETIRLVEVHWKPAPKRSSTIPTDEVLSKTCTMKIDGRQVKVLSPEHRTVMLTFHMVNHGWRDGSLRSLLDLSLSASDPEIDWREVARMVQSQRSRGYGYHVLSWAREEMGARLPEDVLQALAPSAYERWSCRPMRKFGEVVTLEDQGGYHGRISDIVKEISSIHSVRDKIAFLLGIVAPPSRGLSQMSGLPSGWQLGLAYLRRPFAVPWKVARGLTHRDRGEADAVCEAELQPRHKP